MYHSFSLICKALPQATQPTLLAIKSTVGNKLLPVDRVEPINVKDIQTTFLLTPPPFQSTSQ